MDDLTMYWGLASIPIILALVEIIKPWVADKRAYPLLAVICGIVWNIGMGLVLHVPIAHSAILGVLSGLSACGMYSVGSTFNLGVAAKKTTTAPAETTPEQSDVDAFRQTYTAYLKELVTRWGGIDPETKQSMDDAWVERKVNLAVDMFVKKQLPPNFPYL